MMPGRNRLSVNAPPVARCARLIDPGITANGGDADIARRPRLVDAGIAMDIASRTGLVDARVSADSRRTDIACHAGLVDAGVAMNVTGSTRLVDPGITCVGRHRQRGERRAKNQGGKKPAPETARSSGCPFAIIG
jgi:hypothetical protein